MKAVVDVKTKRIACVLLQAAYGGDTYVPHMFDVADWDTFPTDDMRMVEGTRDEWKALAERHRAKRRATQEKGEPR